MNLAVVAGKGGVGKTTTAVTLCGWLNLSAPAVLLDGDKTRGATTWAERRSVLGEPDGLPFRVAPAGYSGRLARKYQHVVIDTGQNPSLDDLRDAARECDLLVVPAAPAGLDTDGLVKTIGMLEGIPEARYMVLLTMVPAFKARATLNLRRQLAEIGAPVFVGEIPRLDAFDKAAIQGVLVRDVQDANAARAWAAYGAVAAEIEAMMRVEVAGVTA